MIETLRQQGRKPNVLLVEDNEDHAFLTTEAFTESGYDVQLRHVATGEECMAYLRQQPPYEQAIRPDLVLLDIHMPRMNGYEVMQAMMADPALRSIVVVVMSTSAANEDVNRMHALGCNAYVVKPRDFEALAATLRHLSEHWFGSVLLPAGA